MSALVRPLKVLIACEFTGTVRRAFDALGHDVWSCDRRPALDRSNRHITGDVRDVLRDDWDLMMVAHPPCTRLCNSGVRWLSEPPGQLEADTYSEQERAEYARMDRDGRLAFMWAKLDEGADLFSTLWNADIPRIAVENPVMHKHAKARIAGYREFAQSVQPWQFGDVETKRTCFWLRNLPCLVPQYRTLDEARAGLGFTGKPVARVHLVSPGAERRSRRPELGRRQSKPTETVASAAAKRSRDSSQSTTRTETGESIVNRLVEDIAFINGLRSKGSRAMGSGFSASTATAREDNMASAHTKGPWRIGSTFDDASIEVCNDAQMLAQTVWPGDEDENLANARLIAAAPEMYECLQEAVECVAWCRKHHSDPQSGTGFPAEVRWIAALAKAEGREP